MSELLVQTTYVDGYLTGEDRPDGFRFCRVYWGSHGCKFERGHEGLCECDCCDCPDHVVSNIDEDGVYCVAKPDYYGPDTRFYGEDVQTGGLPAIEPLERPDG